MASLYLAKDDDAASERLYRELLARNPKNEAPGRPGAHRARQGDLDGAAALLNKAEQAGVPKDRLACNGQKCTCSPETWKKPVSWCRIGRDESPIAAKRG